MGIRRGPVRKAAIASLTLALSLFGVGGSAGYASQDAPKKPAASLAPANVPEAVARVKSGDFTILDVEMIRRARATEAMPSLREQFPRAQDPRTKGAIATALARMGEANDTYWNYLVSAATPAIEAPSVMILDAKGQPVLVEWAKTHNLSPESVATDVIVPFAVANLADTGDPRAIPLLRKGLLSQNFIVQTFAAEGLVKLNDKDSIPLIIDACNKATPDIAEGIASHSLIYLSDQSAQDATAKFIPKERLDLYRKSGMFPANDSAK
jgi:hypothetical protein